MFLISASWSAMPSRRGWTNTAGTKRARKAVTAKRRSTGAKSLGGQDQRFLFRKVKHEDEMVLVAMNFSC